MTGETKSGSHAERVKRERQGRSTRRVVSSAPGFRPESAVDREIARKAHLIHRLKAKDSTGRWAYYFVLIEPVREKAFREALGSNGAIDLEDFGRVIASCYGETPTDEVRAMLKDRYGFDV